VPGEATAGLPSVAVRMPSHPLFRRLIRLAGVPLAAPSANPFGYVSPTTAAHVLQGLGGRIRDILDGGPSSIGLESTIVDLRDPRRPAILRPGAITRSEVSRALGLPVAKSRAPAKGRGLLAPGQMARHYSPRTPVVLHARLAPRDAARGPADAWLFVSRPPGPLTPNVFWLDAGGGPAARGAQAFCGPSRAGRRGFPEDPRRAPRGRRPCGGPARPPGPRVLPLTVPAGGPTGGLPRAGYRTAASSLRSLSFCAGVPAVTRIHSGSP
jgi:hypothetical protein